MRNSCRRSVTTTALHRGDELASKSKGWVALLMGAFKSSNGIKAMRFLQCFYSVRP